MRLSYIRAKTVFIVLRLYVEPVRVLRTHGLGKRHGTSLSCFRNYKEKRAHIAMGVTPANSDTPVSRFVEIFPEGDQQVKLLLPHLRALLFHLQASHTIALAEAFAVL